MTPNLDASRGDDIHLFVISGCSGSGKSTLLAELAKSGEMVVSEPGRKIVQREIEDGGAGLPLEDAQRLRGGAIRTGSTGRPRVRARVEFVLSTIAASPQ